MFSWEDLTDFGSKALDWATGDSTSAQLARDAATGLVIHHATGGKGEDNLGALAGGAALGQGARYLMGGPSYFNNTPAQTAAGMSPQVSSSTWSPTSAGNPNVYSTSMSNAVPASATGQSFGAGVGDMATTGMDKAQSALEGAQSFGKKYAKPLDIGMKGLAYLKNSADKRQAQGQLDTYAQQEQGVNSQNQAIVDATNKARGDVYANQQAQIGMAGKSAAAGSDAATARQLAALGKATGISSGARQALERGTSVAGARNKSTAYTQADSAARAGLQAPTPEYARSPMTSAGGQALNYRKAGQGEDLRDLYDMGREVFGFNDQAKQQVSGAT